MNDEERTKLLSYAYFYLKIRPRTVKEVRDYLAKKAKKFGFHDDVIDSILKRLLELKLLDDSEFVRWYVEGKYASSRKSAYLLKNELARLGVSKSDMENYFSEASPDDTEAARVALRPKWKRFAPLDPKDRFKKAASFLSRRGFPYDIIKKTIAEYEGDE